MRAAASIQAATHPTGENPRLTGYEVTRLSDRLAVRISVGWQGGFTGSTYTTIVLWEFSERGHVSTTIVSDDSVIPASEAGVQRLDGWTTGSRRRSTHRSTPTQAAERRPHAPRYRGCVG